MNRLSQFQQTESHRAPISWASLLVSTPRPRPRSTRQALRDALQGLREAWHTQLNLRLHVRVALGIIVLGVALGLSWLEWLWVSLAVGLVIFAELVNTAIEWLVDLVVGLRPDPLARQVKDVAAGGVLVAVFIAVIVGCFTFVSHVLKG